MSIGYSHVMSIGYSHVMSIEIVNAFLSNYYFKLYLRNISFGVWGMVLRCGDSGMWGAI